MEQVGHLTMAYEGSLYSKAYAATPDTDSFSIQADQQLWQEIIRDQTGRRVFLSVQQPDDTRPPWIAPLGAPVHDVERPDGHSLYMPLWMIDAGHFHGIGEPVEIDVLEEDSFPAATRIVLRVIDSAFYNTDVKAELERALSAIGVIRTHTTLQIPLASMDNYSIDVFVAHTEPADLVLCEGEEVALEFEEPVDQIAPLRPPTPIPEVPALLEPMASTDGLFGGSSATGSPFATAGQGQALGGSNDQTVGSPWAQRYRQKSKNG